MSIIEEMIFDINYLLENIFDDIINLMNTLPYDEIHYNKSDKELFYKYVTFYNCYINIIRLVKDFKETKILNLFDTYRNNITNIDLSRVLKIDYRRHKNIKDGLIYIRDILLPLYNQMKKNKSI
jgi:hypothetical protein